MISTNIRFNSHNSYNITTPLLSFPFNVSGFEYITHSFQAFALTPLSAEIRAKTKFFDEDGVFISEINHTFPVSAVFDKVEITVEVPLTAVQAQLIFLKGTTSWWISEPKSESGTVATPFNMNITTQLTFITSSGIYTGMVNANQIVVSGTIETPNETLPEKLATITSEQLTFSSVLDSHTNSIATLTSEALTLTDLVNNKTTKITASGVYTGDVVANQVKTGKVQSTSGATYFDLDNAEIYMNGGTKGRIQISPTAGFKMLDNAGNQIGGLINMGGQLVSMATRLTNNSNPNFWATIGDDVIYGKSLSGIFGYTKLDTLNPAFKILGGQVNTGSYAGNYGIFTSKNEKSLITTYEYQNIGRVFLEAFGASGEYGKMEFTGYGMDMTFPQYYFSVDAYGIQHGKDVVFSYKVPMQQVGTVHNISSAASTAVTFPLAFPAGSAVKVFATPTTTATGVIVPKIFNESPTGFSVVLGGSGFSGISVNWTAVVA